MTDHQSFKVRSAKSLHLVGRCYITDPCYFIKDGMWSDLCDVWFDAERETDLSKGCVLEVGKVKILITRTCHGDGSYKVEGAEGDREFCVDSGTFAIAQVDLMEAQGLKHEEHCSTYITFDRPTLVSVDGAGRMFQGSDTLVDTVLELVDEYDEYEGADYDDEDDE